MLRAAHGLGRGAAGFILCCLWVSLMDWRLGGKLNRRCSIEASWHAVLAVLPLSFAPKASNKVPQHSWP